MKKYLIPLLGALLFGGVSAAAQDDHVKTGWSCIPVPDVSYSTDIGWNFGAFGDLFYYGDGSTYPNFIHHIALAGARSTRGAWYLHGMFDSKTLIPGRRFAASLTYRDCTMNNFYGFNGLNTPYFPELDLNAETHQAYYTDHRKVIRSAATIWSPLGNTGHLDWIGGLVFRRIRISDFTHDNYNSDNTLYRDLTGARLIRADEAAGGTSLEARLGVTYDTRDIELAPNKGIYGEIYVNGNADLSHGKYHYGQLVAHFKHFIPIIFGRLTFAYHLGLQHQFAGQMPWYNLNEISTLYYQYEEYEGLCSRYTLRGFHYNRITASGYAWSNFELRADILKFRLFNQQFDLIVNPFLDAGAITRRFRPEEHEKLGAILDGNELYRKNTDGEWLHASAGIGGKIHVNTNFILSLEWAKGFNPQLADKTLTMSTTYVF